MFVDFNILNQLGSPSINSNTFANRPSAGQVGRLFVSTDTFEIYRDNGTGWDLIGGPGSSTVTGSGAAGQVTYWTGTNSVGGENNLWWDAANNRFGVNTNTPTAAAEVVQTDGVALYSNFTTNAGSGTGTTALWAINNTNSSGYAAVIEEKTPNTTAGQYPLVVKHSLSSGTAGIGMGTGLHFQLPDDAGTYKTTQLTIETIDAAAATYKTRYRFMVQNNGSSTAVAYLNSTGLGLFTATPGAALDIHSTGVIAQLNSTGATNNGYLAFQRSGTGVWRIGDTYNGGNNYFELHNTVLTSNAIEVTAASNEALFVSAKTYTTGNAIGVAVMHNLTIPNGTNVGLAAIGGVNSNLNLSLGGSTTIANTGRQGLEGSTTISFTGAGTLTMTQGTTLRALSALSTVYAFNGSAVGTITHLAGMRICFPDNPGSAVNITNNYGILINDQTTGTGTVTYTNRWGVYQEGTSDLNYFAGNTLIGTTTNTGDKLNVNGNINIATQTFFRYNGDTGLIGSGTSISGGTANELGIRAANDILFATNGANERMRITAAGLVGIGTSAPQTKLHVSNASSSILLTETSSIACIVGANAAGTASQELFLKGFPLTFTGNGGSGAEAMRITSSGQVGIGTSAPSNILQSYAGGLTVNDESTYSARFSNNSNKGVVIGYDSTNNRGHIGSINPGVSWSNTIINANGGNVGICGTSANLSGSSNAFTVNTSTAANFSALELASGGALNFYINGNNTDNYISSQGTRPLRIFTNGAERLQVNSSGNVLIGTTTDAGQKLQVNGTSYLNGNTSVNTSTAKGALNVNGTFGLTNGAVRTYTATGDIVINVSDLNTLNGNNWRNAFVLIAYSGVEGNQSNDTTIYCMVKLQGLTTWNSATVSNIVGTATVTLTNAASTSCTLTLDVNDSIVGSAYVVLADVNSGNLS